MVYKWELQIPKLMPELKRRAYLYLPACYDEQPVYVRRPQRFL